MKVFTEPWGEYSALVMCCSDGFNFHSKINVCFIKRMSCLFIGTQTTLDTPLSSNSKYISRKLKDEEFRTLDVKAAKGTLRIKKEERGDVQKQEMIGT